MIWRLIATALLLSPHPAAAQSVPEGVHSVASGPTEMCGLVAASISELKRKAMDSDVLDPVALPTSRFEMFASASQDDQLVFTTESEPAYPAATCRHLYEEGGQLRMSRQMRCDAGRAECDALFLEFQELDAGLTRALQGEED